MSDEVEHEDSPTVAPHGGPIRRLIMKHPFWVATIFGLLFFPTLKLCTIRHTPPVPVLGQVADATTTGVAGEDVQLPLDTGRPWFVACLGAQDTRTTPAVISALRDLRSRMTRERFQLPVVVLLAPGASEEDSASIHAKLGSRDDQVFVMTATSDVMTRLRTSLAPALGTDVPGFGPIARIGLIDDVGTIRSGAPIGTLGLDQLTQRALALKPPNAGQ